MTILKQPPEVSLKKGVLRNFAKFTGKYLDQRSFFNKVAGSIKKESLAQVFSCEFCEISKNTFSGRTPLVDSFSRNREKDGTKKTDLIEIMKT